ncbi:hypothetical protein N0V82_000964 [Gnomoniopsis sp. IMI 355080]|nr:hypothetical protein N0V82_000964 [Gnomoniopsis sp. IMI 355080]
MVKIVLTEYLYNREHVKRHHTPSYNCIHCGLRWLASEYNDHTLTAVRTAHLESCGLDHGRLAREFRSDESEIMTEKGEERFRGLRQIRKNNEKKLEELYQACGKDLPETYHVRPLEGQVVQNQLPEFPPPASTGSNSTLLDGFTRPDPDPTLGPSRVLSWEQRDRNTTPQIGAWVSTSELVVPSGADAARENRDSGYGGSAELGTLCPVVDQDSLLYGGGGPSTQGNEHLPEPNAFGWLDYGAHEEYPIEIDIWSREEGLSEEGMS